MTKWNDNSGVTACEICEGSGVIASHRQATINDPYPEEPCPNGCAEHSAECAVCGFDVEIAGFDCLACETVAILHDPAGFNSCKFFEALKRAFDAAVADKP